MENLKLALIISLLGSYSQEKTRVERCHMQGYSSQCIVRKNSKQSYIINENDEVYVSSIKKSSPITKADAAIIIAGGINIILLRDK